MLYTAEDQTIYDEYDKGYILKWLVTNSNEYDMEPLMLTLKPGASYKHFQPSNSDTFIYCLEGQITFVTREPTLSCKCRRRTLFQGK